MILEMTAMDFLPSDLEQMNTNFLDMIENDANQILDIENLNSDKLNDILNGDGLQDSLQESMNSHMDYSEMDDVNNSNWFHSLQWNDTSKIPQSLIDASNEVENNNPNLLVNPQSVLPVHSTHQPVQNTTQQVQHMNQLNTRNAIAVKINGHDAVLTPTQHPQIQYVTVQNATLNSGPVGYTVQPITLCQQQLQNVQTISSPSLTSPVLVEHLQNGVQNSQVLNNNNKVHVQPKKQEKVYPKPVYSYSCLIAMALKNSRTGNLPVSEIYNFMIDNFPYFKTAPDGWKNSVRHNLSLNKCFAKVESNKPAGHHTRKGCLWALNPAKIEKMEDEIVKWRKKDPESVRLSMSKPENLELIEQGKAGPPRSDSDEPLTPIKLEPMSPAKPAGRPATVSQLCQTPTEHTIKQETAVVVKESAGNLTVTSVNPFDPALSDLALQNGVWEDELTIGVGNAVHTTMSSVAAQTPTGTTVGTQYHGNITYTTCASPLQNTTPTKLYPPTPTKIYPSTPTRVILA